MVVKIFLMICSAQYFHGTVVKILKNKQTLKQTRLHTMDLGEY